jgi:hypothetical protein
MNSKKRILLGTLLSVIFLPILSSIAGCGGPPATEGAAETARRVDAVQQEQAIINRSDGTFDSLNQYDKNALIKLVGSEQAARAAFGHMHPVKASVANGGNPGLPDHTPANFGH